MPIHSRSWRAAPSPFASDETALSVRGALPAENRSPGENAATVRAFDNAAGCPRRLAILEGEINANDGTAEAKEFLRAYNREYNTFQTLALDALIPGTETALMDALEPSLRQGRKGDRVSALSSNFLFHDTSHDVTITADQDGSLAIG